MTYIIATYQRIYWPLLAATVGCNVGLLLLALLIR